MSTSLLLNERFVAVFPSLVRLLGGVADAAVLQEIHYQLQIGGKEHDGNRWVPATFKDLSTAIGLSPDAISRTAKRLKDKGVLVTANPEAFQRRTWWRIDYTLLDHLAETQNGNGETAGSQNAKPRNPKRETASSTTSKKLKEVKETDTPNGGDIVKAFVDYFTTLYGEAPDSRLIGRIGRDAKRMLAEGKSVAMLIQGAEECARAGHANLPATYTQGVKKQNTTPRGFAGIREFIQELK